MSFRMNDMRGEEGRVMGRGRRERRTSFYMAVSACICLYADPVDVVSTRAAGGPPRVGAASGNFVCLYECHGGVRGRRKRRRGRKEGWESFSSF